MTSKSYKLIVFFLCTFFANFLLGQDVDLSKKITLELKNVSVEDALNEIALLSGISFSYSSNLIDPDEKISLSAKKETVEDVLTGLIQHLGLDYSVVENKIIIKKPTKRKSTEKKDSKGRFTINGYIKDKVTGESLIGATIRISGTSTGTISNSYGFYSLSLPEGEHIIEFSYIGYLKNTQIINLNKNIRFNLSLGHDPELLNEVIIIADETLEMLEKSQMSQMKIVPANIARMPEFAGEVGLIKTLQTLPGIKTHSDGSAFFFVRGGNKDQNLILIDEAPVYNPGHLFGYYSVIDPGVAKDIKIYKGDMPVNQGDRLSSVIDVHTKDGNLNRFELNGMLNPFIYKLSIEGPFTKQKSSYFVSFRHSNFNWLYRNAAPNMDLYLYDINAKANIRVGKNDRIYYTFFYGKDKLMNTQTGNEGGIQWDNLASTLRWNHVYSKKLFSNTMIFGSRYNYKLLSYNTTWNSAIQNVNFKTDYSWYMSPKNTFKFGFSLNFQSFTPGNLTYDTTSFYISQVPKTKSRQITFYLDDELDITKRLSLRAGIRLPVWVNVGPTTVYMYDADYNLSDSIVVQEGDAYKSFVNLDPRISLKYRLDSTSSIKCSYGINHQYVQLISNSISPFTSLEVWLPAGTNIKPQRADQVALGYVKYFPKVHLEFTAETYYKYMRNQIDYEPHANLLLNPLMGGELRFGDAWSYGIELMLKRTQGKLTGWMAYTWSKTYKQIEGLNNNEPFPAFYDRPHDFSIYLSWQVSKRSNLSFTWVYYTGSAITTPIGYYDYQGYSVPLYGEKNNDRLPDYHRLDFAFTLTLNKQERRFRHSLAFAVYNLYNRENPVSINFNKIETKNGEFVVPADIYGTHEIVTTQKYLLGIVPSITYKFKI